MTFSIAIPVYNGAKYLRETLQSVIRQTRPPDEILVVDDASIDDSRKIIEEFQKHYPIRYEYNRQPTGFVDAWNRVVAHAQADYVTILHQDDLLDPEYLYYIERALISYPSCKHIYSGYYYIDEHDNRIAESRKPHTIDPKMFSGREYAHRYLDSVVRNRHLHRCPGVTTERNLLLEKCKYRKEAGLIADDDFFLRVGQFTNVIEISQPLASFREHDESATAQLESLSHRLAEDYVYQTRHYRARPSMLLESDICLIQDQAIRFINSFFVESLLKNNVESLDRARNLRLEFENLVVDYFSKNSFFVVRLLWMVVDTVRPGSVVISIISKSLRVLMQLKKLFFLTTQSERNASFSQKDSSFSPP